MDTNGYLRFRRDLKKPIGGACRASTTSASTA